MLARPLGVDMVVTDAEARNLLDVGKLLKKISVDLVGRVGDRNRFDPVANVLDEGGLVLGVEPVVERSPCPRSPSSSGLLGPDH
jgi:hypothetical protein